MADPKGNLVTPVAFDPSGYPLALEVDANGYLKVATASADNFLVGTHGYVSGAWHKSPISLGYSSIVGERIINTNLPAGNSDINSTAVPEGKIHILTNLAYLYIGNTATTLGLGIYRAPTNFTIFVTYSPVSARYYDRQGWWVLKAGDLCRLSVFGATAGDDLYLDIVGFAVDINL